MIVPSAAATQELFSVDGFRRGWPLHLKNTRTDFKDFECCNARAEAGRGRGLVRDLGVDKCIVRLDVAMVSRRSAQVR